MAMHKHIMDGDELTLHIVYCECLGLARAAECCRPSATSLPLLSLQRTVNRTEIEMGIFTNPSNVPEPGPPPKKETVRVELSGCGFLVKYHCNFLLYNKSLIFFLSSVVRWSDLLF